MTVQIQWSEDARADLASALAWYQQQRDGLDEALLDMLERTLVDLRNNPALSSKVGNLSRRVSLHRFPYSVYFTVSDQFAFKEHIT